jgi:hypothetical protein
VSVCACVCVCVWRGDNSCMDYQRITNTIHSPPHTSDASLGRSPGTSARWPRSQTCQAGTGSTQAQAGHRQSPLLVPLLLPPLPRMPMPRAPVLPDTCQRGSAARSGFAPATAATCRGGRRSSRTAHCQTGTGLGLCKRICVSLPLSHPLSLYLLRSLPLACLLGT